MKFQRNLFFPIRLIVYPALLETMAGISGFIVSETVWLIISLVSTLLLVEAIWEFVHPYAELNGSELLINASLLSRKKIDLSKFTKEDVEFLDWHVKIGEDYISLRAIRSGHRDRFEEAMEIYFGIATAEEEIHKNTATKPTQN